MKNFLNTTAGTPTTALPLRDSSLGSALDTVSALRRIRERTDDGRFLISLHLEREATDPEFFRFVARTDQMDLKDDNNFILLEPARLEKLIGHPILIAEDGRPILSNQERATLSMTLAIEEGIIRNPKLTAKEKRSVLDRIKADAKAPRGFTIESYKINSLMSEVDTPADWTPFDEKMKRFATDEIEQLLGRKLERGQNLKHMVSDVEADFLGMALGMHEAIHNEQVRREKQIKFGACVKKCAALHGNGAAKRLSRFMRKELGKNIKRLSGELADHRTEIRATQEICEWRYLQFVLERPHSSRLQDIRQTILNGETVLLFTDTVYDYEEDIIGDDLHGFVIEHDWAKAFEGTGDFDVGEFALPYQQCFFEFKVTGRRVGILVSQNDQGTLMSPFFSWSEGWSILPAYTLDLGTGAVSIGNGTEHSRLEILATFLPLMSFLAKSIRAVCISLEAKVTETTIIRADHKLNHAREKRGKLPLYDYHVVSLARRSRAPALLQTLDPDREITHKRCHYRRGHYRHFENHKTWIKWQLVGDADLGFVDKNYRL